MTNIKKFTIVAVLLFILIPSFTMAYEANLSSSDYLAVKSSYDSQVSSFLIKFDMPQCLNNTRIDMAILTMTVSIDSANGGDAVVYCGPLINSWQGSETPAVMESPEIDNSIMSYIMVNPLDEVEIKIDIAEIVQAWVSGHIDDNGILVSIYNGQVTYFDISQLTNGAKANLIIKYVPSMSE
jgi:hypothetical protein